MALVRAVLAARSRRSGAAIRVDQKPLFVLARPEAEDEGEEEDEERRDGEAVEEVVKEPERDN